MPIRGFHPAPGTALLCDFDLHRTDRNIRSPEMTKRRPVIVLSRRDCHFGSYVVVPLSTTPPRHVYPFHYLIPAGTYPFFHLERDSWVKCDMLGAVGYYRLDRLRHRGRWMTPQLHREDFRQICLRVRYVLGLAS